MLARFSPRAKLGTTLAASLTGLMLIGWSQPAGRVVDPPAMPAYPDDGLVDAVVMEVLDGDSVVLLLDGELRRVEIAGADAPEWVERAKEPRSYSVEARRFLINFIQGERVAVLEPDPGATDQLGRRRAHLFRATDQTMVDLEIVRQGYGKVAARASGPYREILDWYETRAKELDRGLWGDRKADEPGEPGAQPPVTQSPETVTEPAKPTKEKQPAETGWVWVTKSGSKYHREDCSHLSESRKRVRREDVKDTHEACRTCNPDD